MLVERISNLELQILPMVDMINMLLLEKFRGRLPEDSGEFVSRWLMNGQNYLRLQRECDKIWVHQIENEHYDAERAFRVLGLRLDGICRMENASLHQTNF